MDISIIIPVFNTQEFLRRCLDSIFNQEVYGEFEVIAINDGSTDGSLEILQEYVSMYSNFRLLDFNGNYSNAVSRRNGINSAKGEYIMCIDSDDFIKPDSLQKLLNYRDHYKKPDVIVYDYERHDGKANLPSKVNITDFKTYNSLNKNLIQNFFMGSCWSKMVKRSLLNNIIFGTFYMNNTEDLIYSLEVFIKSKTIVTIPESYYYYFVNLNSLTNNVNIANYINNQTLVFNTLFDIKNKYGDSSYFEAVFDYLKLGLVQFFFLNHLKKSLNKTEIKDFFKAYNKNVDESRQQYMKRIECNFLFSFSEMLKVFGLIPTLKIIIKQIGK